MPTKTGDEAFLATVDTAVSLIKVTLENNQISIPGWDKENTSEHIREGLVAIAQRIEDYLHCPAHPSDAGKAEPAPEPYQYPVAHLFHRLSVLADSVAGQIEQNKGRTFDTCVSTEFTSFNMLIDRLQDMGALDLKSVKVVQGLSISELMRMAGANEA